MKSYFRDNRRKFPIVNMVLSITFTGAIIGITFWTSSIEARVQSNTTLQKSVLESNLKFSRECKNIKGDMVFIREQLSAIQSAVMKK